MRRIEPARAAAALAGLELRDPRGLCMPDDVIGMCERGECFELELDREGAMVYVVTVKNGVAWIDAAQGQGDANLSALLDGVITEQAEGLKRVAFQTARPGLVRKMQRLGYRVTGWVMAKELDT